MALKLLSEPLILQLFSYKVVTIPKNEPKGVVFVQKRYHFLQICFLFFFVILLGKLAYEQLYRSALLANALTADSAWLIWLRQLLARLPI